MNEKGASTSTLLLSLSRRVAPEPPSFPSSTAQANNTAPSSSSSSSTNRRKKLLRKGESSNATKRGGKFAFNRYYLWPERKGRPRQRVPPPPAAPPPRPRVRLVFSDGLLTYAGGAFGARDSDGLENGVYYGYVDEEGVRDGAGDFSYADGRKFHGVFRKGALVEGTMAYADGSRFTGSWRDGFRDGRGVFAYASGARYEGYFFEGMRHGLGVMCRADGVTPAVVGGDGYIEWRNDRAVPALRGRQPLREVYGGERDARTGKPQGRGIVRFPSGEVYEGQFWEGKPHGEGTLYYAAAAAAAAAEGRAGPRAARSSSWCCSGCTRTIASADQSRPSVRCGRRSASRPPQS